MSSLNNLSLFLYTLGLVTLTAASSNNYHVYHNCTGSTLAQNSSYQLNLNHLLSSLSSLAANSNGFYNTTVGSTASDTIYGLFMCRGDIPANECKECVINATKKLSSDCAMKKEAITWFDKCLVRYSNRDFFTATDEGPVSGFSNEENLSRDWDKFKKILSSLMNDLAIAANDGPTASRRFSAKQVKLDGGGGGEHDTLYGLAQCLPYLSRANCKRCLRDASAGFDKCCRGKIGAKSLSPSCGVRYEIYPFYSTDDDHAVRGKRQISSLAIILIVVAAAVSLVLCSLSCCILRRKARKNRKAILKENFGEEISKDLESLQFDFGTIEAATNKFSNENMIGGTLSNGLEIAVKRLSERSAQDFGMAKMVSVDQNEENTCRIVGTYGYMSPEYIIFGQFSVKSDVFSFGVMVLEIISGKRNASSSSHQLHLLDDLLNYAWRQWKEKTPFELLDPSLEGCYSKIEALRCIQIGLLCVQEDPDERPTMAAVTLMLNSDSVDLPLPGLPGFFTCSRSKSNLSKMEMNPALSVNDSVPLTVNETSITKFSPR
ncbi:hypothetical protein L6164_035828 [Bauhinia variegata]|uniref:Uncharacterized protein n=1 Tax=Bauhinia variegata TaxID=167791 RepID=A0ACB9KG38_BAUVA|nr:hypothetical protein L6164_035828 [Bauhinia variegata]